MRKPIWAVKPCRAFGFCHLFISCAAVRVFESRAMIRNVCVVRQLRSLAAQSPRLGLANPRSGHSTGFILHFEIFAQIIFTGDGIVDQFLGFSFDDDAAIVD